MGFGPWTSLLKSSFAIILFRPFLFLFFFFAKIYYIVRSFHPILISIHQVVSASVTFLSLVPRIVHFPITFDFYLLWGKIRTGISHGKVKITLYIQGTFGNTMKFTIPWISLWIWTFHIHPMNLRIFKDVHINVWQRNENLQGFLFICVW